MCVPTSTRRQQQMHRTWNRTKGTHTNFAKVYVGVPLSNATHTNLLKCQARPSLYPRSVYSVRLSSDRAEPTILKLTMILLDQNHVSKDVHECG